MAHLVRATDNEMIILFKALDALVVINQYKIHQQTANESKKKKLQSEINMAIEMRGALKGQVVNEY